MRRRLKLRRPRLRPVTTTLPLRVGFIGGIGLARLGGGVDSLAVQPDWVGSLRERTGSNLDLLVVDAAPLGFELDAVAALIEEARSIGARVIGVAATGSPPWARLLDFALELGPVEREENRQRIGRLPIVQSVDPRVVNPIGFRWSSDERLAAVGLGRPREARLGSGAPRARGGGGLLEGRPPRSAGELERLRAYRGVVDHAALHPDVREQAAQIVRLGAGGVPVILKQMSTSLRAPARRRAQRRARAGLPDDSRRPRRTGTSERRYSPRGPAATLPRLGLAKGGRGGGDQAPPATAAERGPGGQPAHLPRARDRAAEPSELPAPRACCRPPRGGVPPPGSRPSSSIGWRAR